MPFVIAIDPVAFSLLGLPVRWYGLVLIAAVAIAVVVGRLQARRRGIDDGVFSDAIVWVAVAAIVGGRALYVLQNEMAIVASDPLHALAVWQGGLSFYGGLVAAMVALAIFARRRGLSLLVLGDIAAPAAAIGQAVGHLGCLISGDSYGVPTDLPWAIVYRDPGAMAPLGVPLHPTQAYESILLAVLFVVLWRGRDRLAALGPGVLASAYLLALAVIRFGLFFLRDEPAILLGLKTAQWIGLGIAAFAIVLFICARRQTRRLSTTPMQLEASQS